MRNLLTRNIVRFAAVLFLSAAGLAHAQVGSLDRYSEKRFDPLSSLRSDDDSNPVTLSAQFTTPTADQPAVLMITARLAPGFHVYSLTQPPGGPVKTTIELRPSTDFRPLASFQAHPAPDVHVDELAWPGLKIEEHHGQVTWYVPIELTAGVDPRSIVIEGMVSTQACKDICIPIEAPFQAKVGSGVPIGPLEPVTKPLVGPTSDGEFRAENSSVTLRGNLQPAQVRPGETATLTLSVDPDMNWHVYARTDVDDSPGSKPTLIAFESTNGLILNPPNTSAPIVEKDATDIGFGIVRYHSGRVSWESKIDVPATAKPGSYLVSGIVGYQACESHNGEFGTCEMPTGVRFQVTVDVGNQTSGGSRPVTFASARYSEASEVARRHADSAVMQTSAEQKDDNKLAAAPVGPNSSGGGGTYDLAQVQITQTKGSLPYYMFLAFVGGIILNLMPCVLPVIGLKVMSFVEQAGKSRLHALILNIWYALGIVSVFMALGGLAIFFGLGWGGQFGSLAFNVTLASIIFAMALSLLGVWEIPIPGFFGSGKAQDAAAKEGPLGAFLKGVVTTVLATPCTGPFMVPAIAWAVNQEAATTMWVFASLGVGMASPYLVIGVKPSLLRFLPKPGQWMETFKHVTGFILLGTVIFILSYIPPPAIVPTLVLMLAIGIACWLISRTSYAASLVDRLQTWALASAIIFLFAVLSYGWLYPEFHESFAARDRLASTEAWQPFSLAKLRQLTVAEGRTVLVDFSAEWCLTCKALERTVLHTDAVNAAIAKGDVVTMYGDFTDYSPEIKETIKALGGAGVPTIAIFPGGDPYRPIVFSGFYTQSGLLAAIEQASGRSTPATTQANAIPRAGEYE